MNKEISKALSAVRDNIRAADNATTAQDKRHALRRAQEGCRTLEKVLEQAEAENFKDKKPQKVRKKTDDGGFAKLANFIITGKAEPPKTS